jgi:hypothetical protein
MKFEWELIENQANPKEFSICVTCKDKLEEQERMPDRKK